MDRFVTLIKTLEIAQQPTISFSSPVGGEFCNGDQVLAALDFVGCSTQIFKMINLTQVPDQRDMIGQ